MTHDEYIVGNRNRRVEDVALELSRHKDLDASFVLRQIEGWQRMRTKVPRWTEVEGIHFPPRLALEQCSGQPAAEYKAQVVSRLIGQATAEQAEATTKGEATVPAGFPAGSFADLTGGMGVDFSFIAPLFNTRTYIEQREELVEAARHNFPLLGLSHAQIVHGDGIEHLRTMEPVDLLYLDPARRDNHGGKTVLIEDCEPNVAALLPLLREKARFVMIKLSPMLDIHRAIATLHSVAPGCISEVHIFSSGGECKDLLLVIVHATTTGQATEPTIYCADEHHTTLTFRASEEAAATCPYAADSSGYLYEPGPSIMKAGAYKTVALRYGVEKLHPNSHLYVSQDLCPDFPGRTFRIERTYTFSKQDLKALAADLKQANLTVRNFPASVADLRKKLKLKEEGSTYLFATTDRNERKMLLKCSKL